MRVLMTTDTLGGVWTFTRELTEGLLQHGDEVHLVSFGRSPSTDQTAWVARLAAQWGQRFSFTATTFALEWMQDNDGFFDLSCELLRQLATTHGVDLLHANQMCFGALGATLPTVVTVHSDVRSWFQACRGEQPEPSSWIERYDQLVRNGLAAADAVVGPTGWMLDAAKYYYGALRRASVIPNGRDVVAAATHTRHLQAVTVGRLWDEGKALDLLHSVVSPIPLLVAGDQEGPDGETAWAAEQLTVLGRLEEQQIVNLFARSSIYIVTSIYEPFGLAPVEAALCGCAVIARDLASLREVWGDAALYFADAPGLSALLEDLWRNAELLSELRSRSRRHARERFSREQMINRYRSHYAACIATRPAASNGERHVA